MPNIQHEWISLTQIAILMSCILAYQTAVKKAAISKFRIKVLQSAFPDGQMAIGCPVRQQLQAISLQE